MDYPSRPAKCAATKAGIGAALDGGNSLTNVGVPVLEKLVDYVASGIGSAAGHLFSGWIARREVQKRLITAEGDVQAQRILVEGQATTMKMIAKAQADARSLLVSSDATVQGEVAFGDLVTQRIQFQEEKRLANIESVVKQSAQELGDKEVQDHEVDHDWTARFFGEVQDVSSQELQWLWAKVLAGEIERPGSTSIKTLNIMKTLDKTMAGLFRKLCSVCISIRPDGNIFVDSRVPSMDGDAGGNALKEYGLGFGQLNVLHEHGLIISDYNSWYDIQASIGIVLGPRKELLRIPFCFQGKYWVLIAKSAAVQGKEFKLSGVSLTKSGQELSRIAGLEAADQYAIDLMKYFERKNLQMTEVGSWEPVIISGKGS